MNKKANYLAFKQEIIERGITQLIHFTPTINLISIFEQGKILSRALLEKFDIEQTDIFDYIEFTDSIRYDDKNFINLSLQHPNHFLFNRFQEKTRTLEHISWCILKIDPSYIYEEQTLFSITNAANGHNKREVGISGDLDKFKRMFSSMIQIISYNGSRTLDRKSLAAKYPTDEQAEILVKDSIPVSAIKQVCFKDSLQLAIGKAALNNIDTSNFVVDATLFANSRI